jgi:diguanylate cyclase (GGDEF)-like protein
MKISRTGPVAGVAPVSAERGPRTKDEKSSPAVREVSDSASVMGIPEAELTPKVRTAIMTLMAEVEQLRQEIDTARKRLSQLEWVADQDSLLPVFNRRAFVRELSRVMSYSERYGTPSSVLYFDINAFKAINDNFGHAAGDAALELVTETLIQNLRESDIVGRLGGDEFGIILSHADRRTANEKAEMLAKRIGDARFVWDGQEIRLDVAYGVYSFKEGEDALRALEEADKAMYQQKNKQKMEA